MEETNSVSYTLIHSLKGNYVLAWCFKIFQSFEEDTTGADPPGSPKIHDSPQAILPSPTAAAISQEQRAKLRSELDVVQSNMAVLGELLSEIKPGQEQPDELELLQVCYDLICLCRVSAFISISRLILNVLNNIKGSLSETVKIL